MKSRRKSSECDTYDIIAYLRTELIDDIIINIFNKVKRIDAALDNLDDTIYKWDFNEYYDILIGVHILPIDENGQTILVRERNHKLYGLIGGKPELQHNLTNLKLFGLTYDSIYNNIAQIDDDPPFTLINNHFINGPPLPGLIGNFKSMEHYTYESLAQTINREYIEEMGDEICNHYSNENITGEAVFLLSQAYKITGRGIKLIMCYYTVMIVDDLPLGVDNTLICNIDDIINRLDVEPYVKRVIKDYVSYVVVREAFDGSLYPNYEPFKPVQSAYIGVLAAMIQIEQHIPYALALNDEMKSLRLSEFEIADSLDYHHDSYCECNFGSLNCKKHIKLTKRLMSKYNDMFTYDNNRHYEICNCGKDAYECHVYRIVYLFNTL
jgi:hypothetical protein